MTDYIKIYSATTGLNTVDDPVRLYFNQETGVSDLSLAENISIDRSGRQLIRPGQTLTTAGEFHSVYSKKGPCFAIEERSTTAAIVEVGNDLSIRGVRSPLTKDQRMSWCRLANQTWYANGKENGVITDGVSENWPDQSVHVGADTNRVFYPAPVGEHIAIAFGRMWIAYNDGGRHIAAYSEPYAFGKFRLSTCYFEFTSRVRMIRPVENGIFISDEERVWFYSGGDPKEVKPTVATDFPALEWSECIDDIDGGDLGSEVGPGQCALWASPEGAILGHAQGHAINLNKEKVIYPENVRQGASVLRGYNFIHIMR